jgi:hypothetical protein
VSEVEPPVGFAPPTMPMPAPAEQPPLAPPDGAPAADDAVVAPARAPRAGELTPAWRIAVIVAWVGALLAYLAVWKTSEEIGIATWWLGPRSNPEPMYVRLIPFAVVAGFVILAGYNLRRLPWISLGGSVVLALIAIPDLSRSGGLAAIEFAIAGAVALVSLGSFSGVYRAAPPDDGR